MCFRLCCNSLWRLFSLLWSKIFYRNVENPELCLNLFFFLQTRSWNDADDDEWLQSYFNLTAHVFTGKSHYSLEKMKKTFISVTPLLCNKSLLLEWAYFQRTTFLKRAKTAIDVFYGIIRMCSVEKNLSLLKTGLTKV